MRKILAIFAGVFSLVVLIVPAMQVLSVAIWLLPLIAGFCFPLVNLGTEICGTRRDFSPLLWIFAGATLTGPWAILLATIIGPSLPVWLQTLLASHTRPALSEQEAFVGGGFVPGEFAGLLALVSIGGLICLLSLCSMYAIARSEMPRQRRIWALRGAVLVIVTGGTLLVHRLAPAFTYLFGFIGYLTGAGFVFGSTDPREEVFGPPMKSPPNPE